LTGPHHKNLFIILIISLLLPAGGCSDKRDVEVKEDRDMVKSYESVDVYGLPDFDRYGITERKNIFFEFIRPIIRAENQRIREDKFKFRQLYARQLNGYRMTDSEKSFVRALMDEYRVGGKLSDNSAWEVLMRRVDVVPIPLASVQAAIESGWGTSRFARIGNNLFGQWCFRESCGIVPDRRAEDAIYEVACFRTVNESVRSYLNNLNSFSAYKHFRALRLKQRMETGSLNSYELAGKLQAYSARRNEYIDELRLMLRVNSEFFLGHCYDGLLAENDEEEENFYSQSGTGISH